MIIDATRLLLFPALMAFAASSDLLTMTISNKVSLALAAGFLVLAPAAGMGIGEIGMHAAAGFTALAVAFCLFACGWIGGGGAQLAPPAPPLARLGPAPPRFFLSPPPRRAAYPLVPPVSPL